MNMQDFIKDFVDEALGHVETMETSLMQLENTDIGDELINNIFRAVHSIKGTAGFFDLKKIVDYSHDIESLLGYFRNEKKLPDSETVDLLLSSVDWMKQILLNIDKIDDFDIEPHSKKLYDKLDEWKKGIKKEVIYSEQKDITDNDSMSTLELLNHEQNLIDKKIKLNESIFEDSVKVKVNLLNDLLNLASELVLARNQLLRTTDRYKNNIPGIDQVLQNVDHITSDLQEKIMLTRMQPLATIFNKFPRIIRELSKKLDKNVNIEIEGANIELDKSIIESLADPLIHLLRNSIDHGIESNIERIKKGKDPVGNIRIKAVHESGKIKIEISDDGGGIDTDKVRLKAIQRNIISSKEVQSYSDKEIMNLIFRPGFSTSDNVTEISGRGVGMDVVKTNIEKLNGYIDIITEKNAGTNFILNVPLTLAIISAFIVNVKNFQFAIPRENIREIVRLKKNEALKKITYVNNTKILNLRNNLIPLIDMYDVFGFDKDNKSNSILKILIVKLDKINYGILVDEVLGIEEILVKPLPKKLKKVNLYSGVTILGDGTISTILDLEGLFKHLEYYIQPGNIQEEKIIDEVKNISKESLLLFRCGGKEIYGIRLSKVSKVEKINNKNLMKAGDKYYVNIKNKTFEVFLPDKINNIIPEEKEDNMFIIIPKQSNKGLLIDSIEDTIETVINKDLEVINNKDFEGTVILDNTMVLLVDIENIINGG